MKPTLFLLLGYPGSGKSTFGKQLSVARGIVRFSSDDIRDYMYGHSAAAHNPKNNPAVFGTIDYMAVQLLVSGQSVLYDANNNRRRDRTRRQKLAAEHGARAVVLWVQTPLEVAKAREAERAGDPNHLPIPSERYDQLVSALQEPGPNEATIVVDGLAPFAEQLRSFDEQLAALESY